MSAPLACSYGAPLSHKHSFQRRVPHHLRLSTRAQAAAAPAVWIALLMCNQTRLVQPPGAFSSCNLTAPTMMQVAEVPGRTNATEKARIAVLGASGYTGEEVVRLLALHPVFDVTVLTGETQAGKVRFLCSAFKSSSSLLAVTAGKCKLSGSSGYFLLEGYATS